MNTWNYRISDTTAHKRYDFLHFVGNIFINMKSLIRSPVTFDTWRFNPGLNQVNSMELQYNIITMSSSNWILSMISNDGNIIW